METRKVQQVGGGTYTVSIPISWAEEHGLEAGGTAYLYTHRDGSLVVRWGEREETALGAVDVELGTSGADAAARTLDAAYTAGFERIRLHMPDETQREAITDRARTLIGVDVTEESDSHVEVRWLLDGDDLSVRQSVRQLRFVATSIHDAALATVAGATAEASSVSDRTAEIERLARLTERQFTRAITLFAELDRLDATRPRVFAEYQTAGELRRVATEAAEIGRQVRRSGAPSSSDLVTRIRSLGDDVSRTVETAADAVVDGGSTATAHEALERADGAARTARELHRTVVAEDPPDVVVLTHVLDSVRRTARHAERIAEIALQRATPS